MSKKHLNFGQGLEFLKFGQGNRGPNQQNRRKAEEKIRKNEGKRGKIDKKFRRRDPYFLFNNVVTWIGEFRLGNKTVYVVFDEESDVLGPRR